MKKFFLLLTPLFLCFLLPQASVAQVGGGFPFPGGIITIPIGPWFPGGFGGGIGGGDGGKPIIPDIDPKPFSLSAPIEAWADLDMGQAVVVFNQDFGTVTVGIIDTMGRTVCSVACDTAAQAEVWLPLPATGHYVLHVANADGEARGEFDL